MTSLRPTDGNTSYNSHESFSFRGEFIHRYQWALLHVDDGESSVGTISSCSDLPSSASRRAGCPPSIPSPLCAPPAALFSVNRARCRPKRILLCLPLRHSRSRGLGPGRSQLPISRYVLYLAKSVAASPAGRIVPLPSAVQILAVPLLSLSCLRPEAPRDGRRQGGTPETARPGQRISRALFVVESSGKGSRISSLTSRVILRLSCMWVFLRFSSAFVFRLS